MDSKLLRTRINTLGISQTALALLVEVTPRAVNLWLSGTRSIPGPLASYVNLLASLPIGMQQAEISRINKGINTMKDGMYSIGFSSIAGSGQGCLVFDGGIIYGVDEGLGQYDGRYQFDEVTNLVNIEMKVLMPKGSGSVLGISQPFDWSLNVKTKIDPNKDSGNISVQTDLGKSINASYQYLRPIPIAA